MCIRTRSAPYKAITFGILLSKVRPLISFIMEAPHLRASSATSDFVVSTEIFISISRNIFSTTGHTLSISSCAATGNEPGRVDSPPTSIIPAPSLYMDSALRMALSIEIYLPPS